MKLFFFLSAFWIHSALAGDFSRLSDQQAVRSCAQLYGAAIDGLTLEYRAQGPKITVKASGGGMRPFDSLTSLKISTVNVGKIEVGEARVVFNRATGRSEILDSAPKAPELQKSLAATIRRDDPDLLVLQEVDNMPALKRLVNGKLDKKYKLLLIEGNDQNNDIAFLVKKDLPFDLDLQSYRNHRSFDSGRKFLTFSRDLPVLTVRKPETDDTVAVFMGTHFKSQRDMPGDPGSHRKRTQQANAVAEIFSQIRKREGNAPVFLMGDFNNEVSGAPEFSSIRDAGFRDAFDLAESKPKDRVTHSYHPRHGTAEYQQLDMVAVAEGKAKGIVQTGQVVPYLDKQGLPLRLPRNHYERSQQPSDHRMVSVTIDFQKIREAMSR